MLKHLILVVSIGFIFGDVLTYEENLERMENCGKLPEYGDYRKNIITVFGNYRMLPISPRHLIMETTAFFFGFGPGLWRFGVNYNVSVECSNGIMPMKDSTNHIWQKGRENVTIVKMVYLGLCNGGTHPQGLVVVEYKLNLSLPYICLSEKVPPTGSKVFLQDTNSLINTTITNCSIPTDVCVSEETKFGDEVVEIEQGKWSLLGNAYYIGNYVYRYFNWKTVEEDVYKQTGIRNKQFTSTSVPTVPTSVIPSSTETSENKKREKKLRKISEEEIMKQTCPKGYECYMFDILAIHFAKEVPPPSSESFQLNVFSFLVLFLLFMSF